MPKGFLSSIAVCLVPLGEGGSRIACIRLLISELILEGASPLYRLWLVLQFRNEFELLLLPADLYLIGATGTRGSLRTSGIPGPRPGPPFFG